MNSFGYHSIPKPSNINNVSNNTVWTLEAVKKNGWIKLSININGNITASTGSITLGTLPEGFRPYRSTILRNYITQNGVPELVEINTSGQIIIYVLSSTSIGDWVIRQDFVFPTSEN